MRKVVASPLRSLDGVAEGPDTFCTDWDDVVAATVTRALLAAGVVDELGLAIAPVIAGSGRRLLDGLPTMRLEPIRSTTSTAVHLLVGHRVIG